MLLFLSRILTMGETTQRETGELGGRHSRGMRGEKLVIYAKQLLTRKSLLNHSADLSHTLVPILFHFLQKGNISHGAKIYRLPPSPEERQKWTNILGKDGPKPGKKEYPQCTREWDLLGFVTSGNISLSEGQGKGKAVSAVSWVKAESEEER
jgi:hypothetical protein